MSVWLASIVFLVCLPVSIGSSVVFARKLDRTASRLGLSEGLLGFLLALGANLPEISAAATALIAGRSLTGVGVILGSNAYNLAALLAGAALVAAPLTVHRQTLVLNGTVNVSLCALALALVRGWLQPWLVFVVALLVLAPYLYLLALRPKDLARFDLSRHSGLRTQLEELVADERDEDVSEHIPASHADYLVLLPALAAVVLASVGLVYAASDLGRRLGVAQLVVGTLVLAAATSLPNMAGAWRLALHGRGRAVLSESLNSNNANLFLGLFLPALIVGTGTSKGASGTAVWLLGLTVLTLFLAGRNGRFSRPEALLVLLAYAGFAVAVVLH